ncbi:hypothetical protein PG989_009016 [Apiospora arundinis]
MSLTLRRAASAPPERRRVTAARLVLFRRSLVRGSESAIESSNYHGLLSVSSASSVRSRVAQVYDMDQESEHTETRDQGFVTSFGVPFTQRQSDQMPPRDIQASPRTVIRPSPSSLSLKTDNMRPSSIRSSGSRNGSSRHALLKPEVSQNHTTEKDLPAPPILIQGDPLFLDDPPTAREVEPPTPTKEETVSNSPTKVDVDPAASKIKDRKPPGIVCLDPTLHPPGTHAKVHHPGLVSGADFCDAGTEVERDSPIRTPETQGSLSPPRITVGRVFRTLTGGDICESEVDVSEHFHRDHTAMTKVRPAMELLLQEESHSGHERVSKVRPADQGDTIAGIHHSGSSPTPQSNNPYPHTTQDHQGHHSISKMRQFSDRASLMAAQPTSDPKEDHQGHIQVHKVQSYHGLSSMLIASLGVPRSTPHISINSSLPGQPLLQEEESSKVASYWGDIPLHTDNTSEVLDPAEELLRKKTSEVINEGSPLVNADNANASTHETQSGSKIRSFSLNAFQEQLGSHRTPSEGRRSTIHVPRILGKISQENKPNHEARPILPEGLDPRRATQWLRELLKYRKSTQPQLTQLPERMHPRHERHSHQNSMDASGKEVLTAVTTFSDKNAAEASAINDAMVNLEQLLSEALHIANNVTEPEEHSHVNDDARRWHAYKGASENSQPASVHESLLGDPSEDEHMPGFHTPPIVFIGAVEGLTHGCEALPLRSIERKGLATPGIRGDKARGPHLPHRESSLHLQATSQRDRSPILPMPPPDRQLKRHSVYPTPWAYVEDQPTSISKSRTKKDVPNSREVREYIRVFHKPPVTSRGSSKSLQKGANWHDVPYTHQNPSTEFRRIEADACSLDGGASDDEIDFGAPFPHRNAAELSSAGVIPPDHSHHISANATRASFRRSAANKARELRNISLRGRSHISIRDANFSLAKSRRRQPIARDWSPIRKCYAATVACISTALIGILIGIYAGLVPSIQYFIVDTNHLAILGNVGLYLSMAFPTFFFWPLPLLHGRKPYILTSLAVAMPLLFPQALAISTPRITYTSLWTTALLLSRALMGVALGFASMNFHSILTDLFGVSLMSRNPHGELVDYCDVRRHGGGLGVWLGIWT